MQPWTEELQGQGEETRQAMNAGSPGAVFLLQAGQATLF